jgi:hypothetical protein
MQIALSAGTVMGIFLMTVIVLGYVAIWGIWHFFSRAAGDEHGDGRAGRDRPTNTQAGVE